MDAGVGEVAPAPLGIVEQVARAGDRSVVGKFIGAVTRGQCGLVHEVDVDRERWANEANLLADNELDIGVGMPGSHTAEL